MKKRRKQKSKPKADDMKKPVRMAWEIVKLPNGSYQWISRRGA